jgi:ribosomal protein S12
MARISQLIKIPRVDKFIKSRSPKLLENPQKKAVCFKGINYITKEAKFR